MLQNIYKEYIYMNLAIDAAIKAYKNNEIPVGAAVTYKDVIIIKGYNQTVKNISLMIDIVGWLIRLMITLLFALYF